MPRLLPSIRPPAVRPVLGAKKIKLGLSINREEGIVVNIRMPGGHIGQSTFPGHWLIPFGVPHKFITPGPLPGLKNFDAGQWLAIVLHDPV